MVGEGGEKKRTEAQRGTDWQKSCTYGLKGGPRGDRSVREGSGAFVRNLGPDLKQT